MPLIEGITPSGKAKAINVTEEGLLMNQQTVNGASGRPTIFDVTGVISTTGDNIIVASPGVGLSIYITRVIIQNESSVSTTVILKGLGNKLRVLGASQGDGIALTFTEKTEIQLEADTALILNLSGANSIGYSIGYYKGTVDE